MCNKMAIQARLNVTRYGSCTMWLAIFLWSVILHGLASQNNPCKIYNRSLIFRCPGDGWPISKNATEIYLNDSEIQSIEEGDFAGQEQLILINLSNNNISYIHENAFKGLYNLENLTLFGNKLEELNPSGLMFLDLTSLTQLIASNNDLLWIKENDFNGLENLQNLDLSQNNISFIHKNAFKNLYRLENLDLASNRLEDLGPFGLSFQHLTSLKYLNLGDNNISKISKYSFLTIAAAKHDVTIIMTNNPIQCDCDFQVLLNWSTSRNIHIQNVVCEKSVQKYACNYTQDDIFYGKSRCIICAEQTNYGCSQVGECPHDSMICKKTIQWSNATKSMSITSGCSFYESCLISESNNSNTCGLGYQDNGDISCSFCCRGNTCLRKSIGGRTKDVTLLLTFIVRASLQQLEAQKELLTSTVKSSISNITNAVEVYVVGFRPQSNLELAYEVLMRLELTIFNTESEEILENSMFIALEDQAKLFTFVNIASINLTAFVEDYGMECNDSALLCSKMTTCTPDQNGTHRCLCESSDFYSVLDKSCIPMENLKVQNLNAVASTADTVTLSWLDNKYGASVIFTIQPTPNEGYMKPGSEGMNGGIWAGLRPSTSYSFTVITTVPADSFLLSKNVSSSIVSAWTKAAHGYACSFQTSTNDRVCSGNNLECSGSLLRCLCSSNYYFSPDLTCRNTNELQVQNLSVLSRSIDTVTLTWTADGHGTNVYYEIWYTSRGDQLQTRILGVDKNRYFSWNQSIAYEATLIGLAPGTEYNFTVASTLPADQFYSPKVVTSSVEAVWTYKAQNFIVLLSYTRRYSSSESFMDDPSSSQYQAEVARIANGIKSAFNNSIKVIGVNIIQFKLVKDGLYQIFLELKVISSVDDTNLKIQQRISDAITTSVSENSGFFSKENLQSLDVSSNETDSSMCPQSVTVSPELGLSEWEASKPGIYRKPCPYNSQLVKALSYATRICVITKDGLAQWTEVNLTACASNTQDDLILELSNINITAANAQNVSEVLKKATRNVESFGAATVNNAVNLLELYRDETILAQPGVMENLMDSVNSLLNVDIKTLQKSQAGNATCRRLLALINYLSDYGPLKDGKMMIKTPNIVLGAQAVEAKETRDVVLIVDTEPDVGLKDTKVIIDLSTTLNPLLTNATSIVIPTQAVIHSLSPDHKNKTRRVSFVVHDSDKLFDAIRSREAQQIDTAKLSDGEKDTNSEQKPLISITKVNSRVIAANVPGIKVQNLTKNVTMSFEYSNTNATNPNCTFWVESSSNEGWSGQGCTLIDIHEGRATCGCNHLTNFALLMDVYQEGSKLSDLDRKILSVISYVGCGISLLALLITLITYSVAKQITQYSISGQSNSRRKLRRDNPSKILINLCMALLLSNLVFLVGMQEYTFGNIAACKAVAVLLHYFLLASLSWMLVEAFYMYLALILVFKTYFTNFMLKCCLVGWGVPLVIIIITLAVDATDNYGFINTGLCWLRNPAFYGAFVAPVCLILLINLITFGFVIRILLGSSSQKLHKTERFGILQRLRGAIAVVVLLGLSWIFAIFAIDQASLAFYYLFAVFNSLQGLFIFIFYCLLKSDTIATWKRLLPCFRGYEDSSNSYSHIRGATNNATAPHDLTERTNHIHSNSSKSSANTKSTVSTILDSRKDSCFSTLSGSNICDNTDETNSPVTKPAPLPLPPKIHQAAETGQTFLTFREPDRSAKEIFIQNPLADTDNELSLKTSNLNNPENNSKHQLRQDTQREFSSSTSKDYKITNNHIDSLIEDFHKASPNSLNLRFSENTTEQQHQSRNGNKELSSSTLNSPNDDSFTENSHTDMPSGSLHLNFQENTTKHLYKDTENMLPSFTSKECAISVNGIDDLEENSHLKKIDNFSPANLKFNFSEEISRQNPHQGTENERPSSTSKECANSANDIDDFQENFHLETPNMSSSENLNFNIPKEISKHNTYQNTEDKSPPSTPKGHVSSANSFHLETPNKSSSENNNFNIPEDLSEQDPHQDSGNKLSTSTSEESVSSIEDDFVHNFHIGVPQKLSPLDKQNLNYPEDVSESNDRLCDPPEDVSESNDTLYDPPEDVSESNDTLYDPPEDVSESNDTLYDPPEDVSESNDTLYDPPEDVSESNDTLCDLPEDVSKSSDTLCDPEVLYVIDKDSSSRPQELLNLSQAESYSSDSDSESSSSAAYSVTEAATHPFSPQDDNNDEFKITFTPVTAQGEIDYSKPSSVHDIIQQFELSRTDDSDNGYTET